MSSAIKIQKFGGMLPGWEDHLLPDGQAADSKNGYLFSGGLQGWRLPKFLRTLTHSTSQFVYRIPTITTNAEGEEIFNNDIEGASTWLEFDDIDTNVVKSQVVNDQFQRYYFASPTTIPKYNTLNRITAGLPAFKLGIPAPGCAPTVTVTGGGNNLILGYNTSAGGSNYVDGNSIYLVPIVPAGAMSLADVQFMPLGTDGAVLFQGVVYEDTDPGSATPTTPGLLVGVGSITQGITNGVLATSQFINQPQLLEGVTYWIGVSINTTELIATGWGTPASASFANTFDNGPPGVASNVLTTGLPNLQMFADLVTADVLEARSYVYTWVSAYGEESPPSPFTLVTGWGNGVWTIGLYTPDAADMGVDRNLAILRLYRTVPGSAGTTVYFFITDISLGSNDPDAQAAIIADAGCLPPNNLYVDILPDSTIALNLIMPSTNYFPPPANLQGISILPNGMYVGFVNNEVWFSEPYYPHAWPPGYVYTTDFPVVGLGDTNGALVACTASHPYLLIGVNPAQMSMIKCSPAQPCTSRGSIVSSSAGVFYISPRGLILVNSSGQVLNTTELWITQERWAQLVPQKYTRAIVLASSYFCFGSVQNNDSSVAQTGFMVQLAQDTGSFSIWPQPGGHRVGFNRLSAPNDFNIKGLLTDPWTGYGITIQNGNVYWYDFVDTDSTMQAYDWASKVYQQNTKKSFEAMKVFFTVPSNTALPGVRNQAEPTDPSWNTLAANQFAIVKVYADIRLTGLATGQMTLVTAREVQKSGELLRIESGFKAENWQFEILGRVVISNMQVATSAKELANV